MYAHLKIPPWVHNPSLRRVNPARLNGRLQRICCRALMVHGGTITTSKAIDWCYRKLAWGAPRRNAHRDAVRRAMLSIGAVKVARVPPYGAWLWRLPDASPPVPEHGAQRERGSDINGLA
jgi:hypothetical protein